MKKIIDFLTRETVLTIAWILAIVSMFFVVPDFKYIDYIDFNTLGILFSLMAVMAGLKICGFFKIIAEKLLQLAGSQRSLELILVLLCFVFSMLITNDVALITFVPLALEVLRYSERKDRVIPVVVMQTIAANLGSMATPIGNPQNLYLFTKSGMSFGKFVSILLPYTLIALALVLLTVVIMTRKSGKISKVSPKQERNVQGKVSGYKIYVYLIMFAACVMVVLKVLPVWLAVVATILVVFFMDKKVLLNVDYALLITFTGFFIFVGNMGRIDVFRDFINSILTGNEFVTSVALSQVVSNVPAAILLSGFTNDWQSLLVGVNIGGLGTLIASMASLISYKFVAAEYNDIKGKYLIKFTAINIVFLIIMISFYFI